MNTLEATNTLTDTESIRHLLTKPCSIGNMVKEQGLSMQGKVRTREKCPQCGNQFKIVEELDIFCDKCNTRPKTFFIVLYYDKSKQRISRDTDGHILDSYRRAHRLLEKIRKDIDDNIFSLSDYLPKEIEQFRGNNQLEKWYTFKVSQDLSPGHLKKVREYIEKYYKPFLGNLNCKQIRTHHIEDFLASLLSNLATKTKKNLMTMLKNFCNWLNRREILLRVPQFPVLSPAEPPIEWICREDQVKILNHVPPYHQPIISFMMRHPIRSSEACALQRKHFNLENMSVHICQAFSLKEIRSRKNKKPYFLPLSHDFDINILKAKLPKAFVFTNTMGEPYTANRLRKIWDKARKKAGLTIKLKNATRHSVASQAVNEGTNLAVVSKALGHSTLEVTKRYASMEIESLRVVVEGRAQVGHIQHIKNSKSLINKDNSG
jgi:integrase